MKKLLIILLSLNAFQLYSQNENTKEYIAVIGKADGTYIPDMVTMRFEVRIIEKKQKDAVRKLNDQTMKLIDKLVKLGVKSDQIKMSNYYLNEAYDYSGSNTKNVGFETSQTLEYEVMFDKDKFYSLVDSISFAGFQNLYFTYHMSLSDSLKAKVKKELISKATIEAKNIALTLSEASNVKLGNIFSIEYTANRYDLYGDFILPPPPPVEIYDAKCEAPKISRNISVRGIDLYQEIRIVYKIIN